MNKLYVLFVVIILLLTGYVFYLKGEISLLKKSSEVTFYRMSHNKFECLNGSEIEIAPWGQRGWSRFCKLNGKKNGPWEAWEYGSLQAKTLYKGGIEIPIDN
jgi:hypothetical protein